MLLVSPVRNEANHLQEVVDGVLAQTRPPDLWLIVDDNSDDGTAEIAARACERAPFVRLVSTPPGYTRSNGDRNAAGGPDRAFNFGLDEVDWRSYTYLGKLDGDIVLPPDFVEGILERFAAEPQLGIGSGAVFEEHGEEWRRIPSALAIGRRCLTPNSRYVRVVKPRSLA